MIVAAAAEATSEGRSVTLRAAFVCLAGIAIHLAGLAVSDISDLTAALQMTLLVLCFCGVLSAWVGRRDPHLGMLIAALAALRLASATWVFHFGLKDDVAMRVVGDLNGLFDAVRYDYYAQDLVQSGMPWGEYFAGARLNTMGIVALAAVVYSAFPADVYLVVLLGVCATALTVLFVHRFASSLFDRRIADLCAIVFCMMPDSLSYGGMLMKETIITMLFMAGCLGLLSLGSNWRAWLRLLVASASLLFFRDGLAMVLIAAAVLVASSSLSVRVRTLVLSLTALLVAVARFVDLGDSGLTFYSVDHALGGYQGDESQLSYAHGYSSSVAAAVGMDITLGRLYMLPVKVLLSFVVPFPPWQWTVSFHSNMILLSQWGFLALLPAAFWQAWVLWKGRGRAIAVLAPLALTLVANALSGPFIYDRYRFPLLPAVLAFGFMGLRNPFVTRRIYPAASAAFGLVVSFYYVFKMVRS